MGINKKDLEVHFWYRFLKVAHIFVLIFFIILSGFFAYDTSQVTRFDSIIMTESEYDEGLKSWLKEGYTTIDFEEAIEEKNGLPQYSFTPYKTITDPAKFWTTWILISLFWCIFLTIARKIMKYVVVGRTKDFSPSETHL